MKILVIAILVFCVFVGSVHSFKCYECSGGKEDEDYSVDQCEKDQKEVDCASGNYTCYKYHGTTTDDKVREARGCTKTESCESFKKLCEEGTDEQKKVAKVKECEAACCVSDGDTPCNGGFTASINMIMIMFAVLCSLKLF